MKTPTPAPEAPKTLTSDLRGPGWLLPGAALLLMFAASAVLAPIAGYRALTDARPARDAQEFVDGAFAKRLDDAFAAALPGRDHAIGLFGALDYGFFDTGAPGVVVGREGWLFTQEEFETPPESARNLDRNLESVVAAQARLARHDIALLVALAPPKASLYPEFLRAPPPPARAAARDAFLRGLAANGVANLDLSAALQAARAEGQAFMARDTHWTPLGADFAARHVAAAAGAAFPGRVIATTDYRRIADAPLAHKGDLQRFTPAGPFAEWLGLKAERVAPFSADAPDGGDAAASLFAVQDIPVALVGTSYSAQSQWSFVAALKLAFKADVLDLSEAGRGPVAPMADFLNGLESMEAKPRLVVWEWPARLADADYAPIPRDD